MDRVQKRQVKVPGKRNLNETSMVWEGLIGFVGTSDKALAMQTEPILVDMVSENIYFDD